MRVLVWNAAGYPRPYVTGVGKHVRNMVGGLAAREGWDVELLLARDHAARAARERAGSPLASVPYRSLPVPRRAADALWRTAGWPPADPGREPFDWVYCPREVFIPTRHADLAVTVHDLYVLEPGCPETRLRHRLDRWTVLARALGRARLVLTVSEFTRGRLTALLGTDAGKIRVVGNGVEAGFFAIASEDPQEVSPLPGMTYALTVGGLTHKKGAPALLGLAEAMRRTCPGVTLVIAGPVDPPFAPALARLRNVLSLARGFNDAAMQRLVRGAGALVALSEYEGFGIPTVEAMAAGVPVIAARRAALPEIVGAAGVLVEPTCPTEVAGLLHDLLHDESWRSTLIAKGRRRAEDFTWGACVDRLAAALTESRTSPVGLQDVA